MNFARRLIPALPGLRALEALDRLGSVTAVADELSLTQSAVSRQLQVLEEQLGVPLLIRARQRVALTEGAKTYAASIRDALDAITTASLKLQTPQTSGDLKLAAQPTFAMRWLVPRMPDFARTHPDITISLATRIDPPDLDREDFDAAIRFGHGTWPGLNSLLLQSEYVLAVCAPSLVPGAVATEDALTLPRLHIRTRPNAWPDWFAAQGLSQPAKLTAGPLLDQHATIHQAALHGLGLALLPDYLVSEDIAAGRLLKLPARAVTLGGNYLTWSATSEPNTATRALRDWLAEQAEPTQGLPH